MLRPLLLTVSTVASLAAGSLIAEGRDSRAVPVARAVDSTPHSRMDARDPLQDAVAAAVIGSVARQFDTDDVTVKLDQVRTTPASIQDREVQGTGRVRLDGDPQWIPFRFAALYDTGSTEVTYPRLQLGEAGRTAATPALSRSLAERIGTALAAEFEGQPVAWTAGPVTVSDDGARFVRVSGTGVADFGAEGQVPAQVEGLYDRRRARWLRVNYELGGAEVEPAPVQVASL